MCRKLIYLASFVLLLFIGSVGRAGLPEWETAINGANPLHWYKFNETTGSDCIDSGSSGLNGTYDGVLLSQGGYFGAGAAVRFDRSAANVVNFPGATNLGGSWTAEYIVRNMKAPSGYDAEALHDNTGGTSIRVAGSTPLGEAGYTQYGVLDYRFIPVVGLTLEDLIVPEGEWMHLVWRNNAGTMTLFFNGKLMGSNSTGITFPRERIGAGGAGWDELNAFLDEAVVFNRALTDADIIAHAQSASLLDPSALRASNPNPADDALLTSFIGGMLGVNLTWTKGYGAATHDVYFGADYAEVEAGTGGTFQGNQPGAETFFVVGYGVTPNDPLPDGLVPDTTYYWRIDEVEEDGVTKHTGDVWSFRVAPAKAYNPIPADEAKYIDTDTDLTWVQGLGVIGQTVYFSDDYDAVNNATTEGKSVANAGTYDPGPLTKSTLYYWRVDTIGVFGAYEGDVWSFRTLPDMPITDPNLVGWWKLDEGQGTTVLDWSGHENRGTLNGPQWVDGYDVGAVEFDGTNDYVDLGTPSELHLPENYTYTAWFKVGRDINGDSGPQYILCIGSRSDLVFGVEDGVGIDGDLSLHYYDTVPGFHAIGVGQTVWSSDDWHMVAGTKDSATGHKIYLDGELKNSDTNTNDDNHATSRMISIGARAWTGHQYFNGTIDDVRIYNKALTQDEIKQVMRGDPLLAWDPSPTNGSIPDILEAALLSWSPGEKASEHDVYFGTDKDAVEFADISDTTGIYRGRRPTTSYPLDEGIEWGGGPYYWRIDEYNTDGIIIRGRVWSFTVADFLRIDDFEDYNVTDKQIWAIWHDGIGYWDLDGVFHPGNNTGSGVGDEDNDSTYMEETIVHGGNMSMPYFFNNDDPAKLKYSEARKMLVDRRDWTEQGVKSLSLWFYGDPNNANAERMYVAISNSNGTTGTVYYEDNDNIVTDATLISAWIEWNIDLNDFQEQGVNLTDVNSIAIGFGTRGGTTPGGAGKMYFDDIRLYPARCVPGILKPAADLNDDCVVDYADIEILASNWLMNTYQVANLGADSTGNNDGEINGNASQSANAKVGAGSLALDGDGDFLNVRGGAFFSALDDDGDGFTAAAWV
ncbi:MAG: LamG domain-containing protein, partial [Planctomycetota bacterium]